MLVGESMWRDLLGSDPHIIGQSIRIDDEPRVVVGVVAASFAFPDRRARFWLPYVVPRVSSDPKLSQRTSGLSTIGRLVPGATAAQAETEGTAAARSVPVTMSTELFFGKGGPPVVHATPLLADETASVRPALLVLAAAASCLLLIACANVANLLLSRGVARERELAVRAAIGAGRQRLARQLITEAALFAVLGTIGGLGITWALVRVLPGDGAGTIPPAGGHPRRRPRVGAGSGQRARGDARVRRPSCPSRRAARRLRIVARWRRGERWRITGQPRQPVPRHSARHRGGVRRTPARRRGAVRTQLDSLDARRRRLHRRPCLDGAGPAAARRVTGPGRRPHRPRLDRVPLAPRRHRRRRGDDDAALAEYGDDHASRFRRPSAPTA